jgi:hypothetical protein
MDNPGNQLKVSFSHVQLYVDKLEPVQAYKDLENSVRHFSDQLEHSGDLDTVEKSKLWQTNYDTQEDGIHTTFVPQNRDVIKQLIVGFGFRVTGFRFPAAANKANTRSILVTSKDPKGVQIVVSAVDPSQDSSDDFDHFDAGTTTVLLVCC